MSGIIGSKLNIRGSGGIAKLGTDGQVLTSSGAGMAAAFEDAAGGGLDWQTIETGSTMTAVAGNGYWIDTTSNACTITLPASASNGDEIMFADYARNWGTNGIELDSNGLNYQGKSDAFTVAYTTDGQSVHIVYSGATNGWIPISDDDVPYNFGNGLFGFGSTSGDTGGVTAVTNKVSNTGVVATDTTGVGTARSYLAACEYGTGKAIFGYGHDGSSHVSMSNLVSGDGVVATDVTGVGTARMQLGACAYGGDKGIFGFGTSASASYNSMTNLVTNLGVVGTDVTGVGTIRSYIAATEYGTDKGIFAYGSDAGHLSMSNLVSSSGVVASDVTGVGTARNYLAACGYGTDTAIFGYGYTGSQQSMTNLVTNLGVVGTDVTGVGTARRGPAATQYGTDKGIFGFGYNGSSETGVTNLVSNAGVVATDTTGVGTARQGPAACSYN